MSETQPSASQPRRWDGMSRRAFLVRGSLATAAVGVAGSVPGLGSLLTTGASDAPEVEPEVAGAGEDAGAVASPLLAHVKDLATGEISLFQGEQEVVVRNPALARQLFSALRP
jgi:hypothetical protein